MGSRQSAAAEDPMTSGMKCLTELPLDLQILICEFLNPLHILTLRQTCKAFQRVTSNRIIWINALMRTCHKNMVFLPSFSIPDMSVGQLERAATTPFRWLALSSKDTKDDIPSHSTSRIRIDTLIERMVDDFQYCQYSDEDDDDGEGPVPLLNFYFYLVPGGRYLVTNSDQNLSVLDLGCASDEDMSSDSRLARVWSTRVRHIQDFDVHPTPDGLGIRILILLTSGALAVFEIYPQSENPKLVRIAAIDYNVDENCPDCFLCGDRVVFFSGEENIIIVWDFVANTIASACVLVPHWKPFWAYELIRVTETALIILDNSDGLLIFILPIPALITRTPLFDIHRDIQRIAPIFTSKHPEIQITSNCHKPDDWYHGVLSALPLYLFQDGNEDDMGYKLEFSSNLSRMSPTPICNPQYIGDGYRPAYRICEDSSATLSQKWGRLYVITASDSSQTRSTYFSRTCLAHTPVFWSFCPVSARLVCTDSRSRHIVISDFCR